MLYFSARLNLSKISIFLHMNQYYLLIYSKKRIKNQMSFLDSSIPPSLKFCLSPRKEKRELFVLKQLSLNL